MPTERPFARPAIVLHALAALGGLVLLVMLIGGYAKHGLALGLSALLVLRLLAEMGHRYQVHRRVPSTPDRATLV